VLPSRQRNAQWSSRRQEIESERSALGTAIDDLYAEWERLGAELAEPADE